MTLFQQCAISGLIGIIFHILMKLRALKKRSKAANIPFVPSSYFKDDWLSIVTSIVAVLTTYWVWDYISTLYPSIVDYLRFAFILVGYAGSYIAHAFLSQAEKKIMSVIDEKTNKADAADLKDYPKQGGTTYDPN